MSRSTSYYMKSLLNSENPEISWSDLAIQINKSETFSPDECVKILKTALQILDEEERYAYLQVEKLEELAKSNSEI